MPGGVTRLGITQDGGWLGDQFHIEQLVVIVEAEQGDQP